jgi:hypothetical protein
MKRKLGKRYKESYAVYNNSGEYYIAGNLLRKLDQSNIG